MKTRLRSTLIVACLSLLAAALPASAQGPGSLDTPFNTAVSVGGSVQATAVLPDGKMIIGGTFTTVGGAAHANIARLHADGSVDASFTASTNNRVESVAVQADGKLVLGGSFTSVNGSAVSTTTGVNRIARLNADGTLDTAFNASGSTGLGGANNWVYSVAVQADGKLVLGGTFTSVNGSTVDAATGVNRIARLHADGTRDTAFNTSGVTGLGGANNTVHSVAVQADGKLVLGGVFTSVNGTARDRLARLTNDAAIQSLTAADTTQVLWSRSGAGPELSAVTFEQSTDGGTTWTALGAGTRVGSTANWQLTGLSLPSTVSVRSRGRSTGGQYSGSSGLIEQVAAFTGLTPPAPTVTSIAPTSGPAAGGTSVTVTGNNLTGATAVTIGGVAATSLSANTATSITCVTPAGTAGTASVVVTTPGGPNVANSLFTYNTPQQSWRQLYFGTTSNSGNAADSFDFDYDGLSNLMEWACGLNPTIASSLPTPVLRNAGNLEFSYTRSVEAVNAGAVFTVEWCDTLAAPSWSTMGVNQTSVSNNGTLQQMKATLPEGTSGRRFVRLRVTSPP